MAGALTAAIAAAFSGGAAVVTDDYFEYTTLLLPGNGTNGAQNNTFLDSSTNNFTITRNGNTTQGTFSPFSQTGWGNYFNGSSQYLTWSPTSSTAFGTAAFTVETWIYLTSAPSTQYIIDNRNASQLTNWAFAFGLTTSGKLGFYDGVNVYEESSASIAVANQWMHCVTVRDASNNISVYINGTRVATGTSTTNISVSSNTSYIGTRYNVANLLVGYVSNTRITKGRAVYDPTQSNLTVPTTPLTRTTGGTNPPQGTECSLLTCQSNRFLDSNGVNTPASSPLTITANGSPTVVAFSPFNPTASWSAATNGGSGYFDGSGDYLNGPTNTATAFNLTGDFTIECWCYFNSVATSYAGIVNWSDSSGWNGFQLFNNAGTLGFEFLTGSAAAGQVSGGAVITGQWYFLQIVRSGSTITFYKNGTSIATATYSSSQTSSSSFIKVGVDRTAANYTTGYISGLRIVNGSALSNSVPTSPPTAITNTRLLLNFTNAGIYDATSKNDLETVGNAQISTAISAKWGSGSMSFDGTGDYLIPNISTSDLYTFGTGAFTVEFWLYLNSTSGVQICIDFRPLATNGPQIILFTNAGVLTFQTSSTVRITGSTLSTGQWYHIALSRSGTDTKMFLNGTQTGSTYSSDTTSYTVGANRPAIGADGANLSSNNLNGYLQDLRITKGYARYTSNFTAPTAAFPTL